ncbi:transcriptional regulator CadC, partial [Escherichia coli]|nr:transcriptional regulator CadC [Escherichia coli]
MLIHGDADSLTRASAQLSELIKSAPNFHYLLAEKALVDLLRNSYQPFDSQALAQLRADISHLATFPELKNTPIMQQVLAVDALTQGRIDEAHRAIDLGIELQMSWLNYV